MFKDYYLPKFAPLIDNYPKTFEDAYKDMLFNTDKKTIRSFNTSLAEFTVTYKNTFDKNKKTIQKNDMATFGMAINEDFFEYYQSLWSIMCKTAWYKINFVTRNGIKDIRFFTKNKYDKYFHISRQFVNASQFFGGIFPFMYGNKSTINMLYHALYYYVLELYDNFENITTIEELKATKFKYPFKYITPEHMLLVAEMPERYDLLSIGEKNKMDFVTFVDYVTNYIECIKADINAYKKIHFYERKRSTEDFYTIKIGLLSRTPRVVSKTPTILEGSSYAHNLEASRNRKKGYKPNFEYELYE